MPRNSRRDESLTLAKAMKSGRLKDFIVQEERRGVSGDSKAFDSVLKVAVKAPKAKRQTSRSQGRGNSGGSQTR